MLASVIIINWNGLNELRALPRRRASREHARRRLRSDRARQRLRGAGRRGRGPPVSEGARSSRSPSTTVSHAATTSPLDRRTGNTWCSSTTTTVPRRDWLRPLVEMQRSSPSAGIVGSKLVDAAGNTSYAGTYFQPAINAYADAGRNYPAARHDEPREAEVYIGCGILIRRDLFGRGRRLRRALLQGYEDFDPCLKVRERGPQGPATRPASAICAHRKRLHEKALSDAGGGAPASGNREFFASRWLDRLYEFRVPRLPDAMGDFSYYTFPRESCSSRSRTRPGACSRWVRRGRARRAPQAPGKAAQVTGVELSAYAAALASSRLDEVRIGDVESMPPRRLARAIRHPRRGRRARAPARSLGGAVSAARLPQGRRDGDREHSQYRPLQDHQKLLFADWRYEPGGILDHTHLRFFTRPA